MADHPELCSLPAELKGMIVHECEDSALLALRLALISDLDLAAETTKLFGMRFVKHRTHFNTRQGLQTLIQITAHSTFGRYVDQNTL